MDWRSTGNRVVVAMLLILSALVITVLTDVVGTRVLRIDQRDLNHIIANARNRAKTYRRIRVTNAPLQQNAAMSYRLAFEQLALLPHDAFVRVRNVVKQGEAADAETAFRQYCQEIRSSRVSDALRCTRCDWRADLLLAERQGEPYFPQTGILGYCLVLGGQLNRLRDPRAAADQYFHAAGFAADLGQGTFPMAVAGIGISKTALRALAELVPSIGDHALLSSIKQDLSALQTVMPSLNPGLSSESALVATALQRIERSYLSQRSTLVARLWPWHAITAWRLSRSMRLAARLDAAATTSDLDQLRQLSHQVDSDGAPGRGAIVYALPPQWDELVQEADDVFKLLVAVQMSVTLQEWHLVHGGYPTILPFTQTSARYELIYRPSSDRHGYELVSPEGMTVLSMKDDVLPVRSPKIE
jgi:hypothetical protein